jgi:hypothetical protein
MDYKIARGKKKILSIIFAENEMHRSVAIFNSMNLKKAMQ